LVLDANENSFFNYTVKRVSSIDGLQQKSA